VRAFVGEAFDDSGSNAPAAAGDKGSFMFKFSRHDAFPWRWWMEGIILELP
jgi:hypothetical protein